LALENEQKCAVTRRDPLRDTRDVSAMRHDKGILQYLSDKLDLFCDRRGLRVVELSTLVQRCDKSSGK
jgi:hypothetical protein